MKKLLMLMMIVGLGLAMSCSDDEPKPAKQKYITGHNGKRALLMNPAQPNGVEKPPPGWICDGSNLCCGPFGTQYRCKQY